MCMLGAPGPSVELGVGGQKGDVGSKCVCPALQALVSET